MGFLTDVTFGTVTLFLNMSASGTVSGLAPASFITVTGTIIRPEFPPRHHEEPIFYPPKPDFKEPKEVEIKGPVKVDIKDKQEVEIKGPVKVDLKEPLSVELKDPFLKEVKVKGEIREEETFLFVEVTSAPAGKGCCNGGCASPCCWSLSAKC